MMQQQGNDEAVRWFVRLRSPTATRSDRHAHGEWLSADPANKQRFDEVVGLWEQLNGLDSWARNELARLNLQAGTGFRRRAMIWIAGLSAAAIIGMVIAWQELFLRESHIRYETAEAEQRQVALDDGSRVQLNALSTIDIEYSTNVRQATLQFGEAIFDVAHDGARPFVVHTRHVQVTAIGTRFAVRQGDEESLVTVLEGRVAVAPANKPNPAMRFARPSDDGRAGDLQQNLILQRDQQARLGALGDVKGLREVNADDETAWREGRLIFKATPLREVAREISRYVPGDIRVASNVPDYPVTGIVQIRSAEAMLDLLSGVVPVTAVPESALVTVLHTND